MYKNLYHAFLYEFIVGLICVVSISLFGGKAIIILALLGLRPFILERDNLEPDKIIYHFYYNVLKVVTTITFSSIIILFILSEFFSIENLNIKILFILVPPYFVCIHGLTGFTYNKYR